ncbi:MAG TPA: hypothetical protein VKF82_07490 [Candidatus Eremiobacteraceae bacterium]|nr:hypothetical protein [Candidatus Eremiobacteraceae bacterium]
MTAIPKTTVVHSFLALAFCAAMVAIGAQPAAAKCPPGTLLTEVHRNIDTGKLAPGSGSQLCLESGKTAHLVADSSLSVTKGTYTFLFWDVRGKLHTTLGVSVATWKSEPAFDATAWYLYQPKCTTPGKCDGGNPNVRTLGFEVDTNKRLPGTPIASVSPATNGWATPQTVVYTNTSAVAITAANPLDFIYWNIFPPTTGASAKGTVLSAGLNAEVLLAIAFYGPNPCTYISPPAPGELGPGAGAGAYQAAAKYDAEQYQACVARHGGATPGP